MPEGDTITVPRRPCHTRSRSVGPRFERCSPAGPHLTKARRAGAQSTRRGAAARTAKPFSGDCISDAMRMHGSAHLTAGRTGDGGRDSASSSRPTPGGLAASTCRAEFTTSGRRTPGSWTGLLGETSTTEPCRASASARTGDREAILNQRAWRNRQRYKSKCCSWRVSFKVVHELSDEQLETILRTARKVMLANVRKRSPQRITTFSLDPRQPTYVFSRGGKPCRKCGTPVAYAKQGRDVRGTYWCPGCQ